MLLSINNLSATEAWAIIIGMSAISAWMFWECRNRGSGGPNW